MKKLLIFLVPTTALAILVIMLTVCMSDVLEQDSNFVIYENFDLRDN